MDNQQSLLYFSTQTELAHHLCERYYKSCFYVYCTEVFDSPNPVSSNPKHMYKLYRDIAKTRDKQNPKLRDTKKALRRVAANKLKMGKISQQQYNAIQWEIIHAETAEFAPLLYLIIRDKVEGRVVEVEITKRANPNSREFIIPDLDATEFECIADI